MKDPYIYEDFDLLIYNADIRDKAKLDEFENRMTNLALIALIKDSFKIHSSHDIFKIHLILFGNVYGWAGKLRSIDIYKEELIINHMSVEYSTHKNIIKEINAINDK